MEGIEFEKTFEADPELKYTYSWDRRNAYRQKVYGIVPARGNLVHIVFLIMCKVYGIVTARGNLRMHSRGE